MRTTKRKMTPLMQEYYLDAQGLSCPIGRAAFLVNRCYNGDPFYRRKSQQQALLQIKIDTAIRWKSHWENGGSLKALSYTHVQWNKMRRERTAELLQQRQSWENKSWGNE